MSLLGAGQTLKCARTEEGSDAIWWQITRK